MNPFGSKRPLALLLGDIFCFILSLWIALALRYLALPSVELFKLHLVPFAFLFALWIVSFYIAGLYGRQTFLLRSKLVSVLANTQAINSGIAVAFFYIIPFFGITPKTILFIYLVVSFLILLAWRAWGYTLLFSRPLVNALLIGSGEEMHELLHEVNSNPAYGLRFVSSIDLSADLSADLGDRETSAFWDGIVSRVYTEEVSLIAIDLMHARVEPILPHLYNLIFSKVSFVDMHKIYEDVFDRVPLSLLGYNWFIENVSASPRATYDALKRLMDIVLSFVLGLVSLIAYPFVILAIRMDDGGDIFIAQERMGKNNRLIRIRKFRTMSSNDHGEYGASGASELKVTKAGKFLRDARLDELPQLWSVFMGGQSLIGPRPELPALVKVYEKEIPYYSVRGILKPGLSGWAQIKQENHPHHGLATDQTKEKLAYDLYYIKNRSLLLDLKIALQTVRTLLSRVGK